MCKSLCMVNLINVWQMFLTYKEKHNIINKREESSVVLKAIMCLFPIRGYLCKAAYQRY